MMTTLAERQWRLDFPSLERMVTLCHAETAMDTLGLRLGYAPSRVGDVDTALRGAGLVDGFGPAPELETALRILARPELVYSLRRRERLEGGSGPTIVAAAGGSTVVASRRIDAVEIELLYSSHPSSMAAAVWAALALGADGVDGVPSWRAQLTPLSAAISSASNRFELAMKLEAQGCAEADAGRLAAALDADVRTEIVAFVQEHDDTQTSIGATVVFDGKSGRLIAAPDIASDGTSWVTFSPASRVRLEQALAKLVDSVSAGPSP